MFIKIPSLVDVASFFPI